MDSPLPVEGASVGRRGTSATAFARIPTVPPSGTAAAGIKVSRPLLDLGICFSSLESQLDLGQIS